MTRTRALFLDRDGVINRDDRYVFRIDDFVFIEGVFEACRRAMTLGFKLIVLTNQSGIARGYFSEHDFKILTGWMLDRMSQEGVRIDGVYFCPHHPTEGKGAYRIQCRCRKPLPGLIEQAVREHDIDLAASALVGDKLRDIEAGLNAGVGHCIMVGAARRSSLPEMLDVPIAGNLLEAVRLLEEDRRQKSAAAS